MAGADPHSDIGIRIMARSAALILTLSLGILAPLAPGEAGAAAPGAAHQERQRIDPAALAGWGVTARVITGKIPTLNIVLVEREVLAAWPRIRAAGLVSAGDADWARAHPLAACRDVAFAAAPMLLHNLYRQDDALDSAPVYVSLRAGADAESRPLFSFNVNRAVVRALHRPSDVAARAVLSPWLKSSLAQRQS